MVSIPYLLKHVYNREQSKLFTVISMFAGGGGSSTGYRLAGGNILAINEFIPAAIETYKSNYPNTYIFPDDIRKLTGKYMCKTLGILPGELDILDGSPPCASFSMNGKREKGWGKEKKYSDSHQRVDDLFFEFIRILNEIRPKVFVAENVKGLTIGSAKNILCSRNKGGFGFTNNQPNIISEFQKCGYNVSCKILNSVMFGVPQLRERLIFIGVRSDLNIIPTFPKRTINNWITVKEAIENAPDAEEPQISIDTVAFKYQLKCKPGQSCDKIHPKGHFFNFGRLPENSPSPTILASGGGKYYLHYKYDRYLNIVEAKRLSGFPDDYILVGNIRQKWERLGRSVPPLMMAAVAKHIYKTILSKI